jgi:L-iditol 2-dehydrogenase
MKVAQLTTLGRIEIATAPDPRPGPDEVLVRIRSVGVCRSDVHYYVDGRIGDAVVTFPHILGHEPAGEVVEVGSAVAGLRPGDRVAIEPAVSCGACEYCLSGRHNICPNVRFLATPPHQGVFSELAALPARAVITMPDGVSFDEAAVAEPLAIGLHAVNLARLELGEGIGIFGAGTIGLCVLLAARAAGAGLIVVTDPLEYRRRKALAIGADVAIDPSSPNAEEQILAAAGAHGLGATFEAAGEQQAVDHAINSTRPGGRALIIGIPREDRLSFDAHPARRKELAILHVRRSNGEAAAALDLIARGAIDVSPLITHRFALIQTDDALRTARDYADGVLKGLVLP